MTFDFWRNTARRVRPLEVSAVLAAAVALGFFGPWWSITLPAMAFGLWKTSARGILGTAALSGVLGWLIPILAKDALSGFRVSARVGGLLKVEGVYVYIVIAMSAGLLAALGAGFAAALGSIALSLLPARVARTQTAREAGNRGLATKEQRPLWQEPPAL